MNETVWLTDPCSACGGARDYGNFTALTCGGCERALCPTCYGTEGEKYEDGACDACIAARISAGLPRYLMATKALSGAEDPAKRIDISRDEPDLCCVYAEEGENYIGNWETGYGFVRVRFPKATTRELCEDDLNHFTSGMFGRTFAPAYALTREQLLHRGPTPKRHDMTSTRSPSSGEAR